jgi:3-oxoacyl-[acyl-carrier-protein] synthase-1/3-oxoacyl-[acyl-carrier-protein] synthase II
MEPKKTSLTFTGMGVVSACGWGLKATSARLFGDQPPEPPKNPLETRFFKLSEGPENDFLPNVFALAAAEEALREAGLTAEILSTLRVGVCIGSTTGSATKLEVFARQFGLGECPDPEPLDNFFESNTAQVLAGHFGFRGPVLLVSNACTSGADAIGIAASWLTADLCDLVICGGTDSIMESTFYGFRSLMLCAPDQCRPFDRNRQGLTLGDGAGILVLEKNSTARASRGRFLGYGSASDAQHPTSPDPEGRGLDLAVRSALEWSDVSLSRIDLVNAHGTGTPHNDLAEGRWVRQNAGHARLVATKGYTGHTLGAAGAVEAIITLLCLSEGFLPASVGFAELDPQIGIAPTQTLERGNYQAALSLSLGFGGINSALALGRAQ